MGRFGGGTNNSSFNGRTTNWQKVKRIKARVAKKRSGAKSKHLDTAVEGVSGKRTGKSQRKSQRKERLRQKEQQNLESGMDVDGEKKPAKNLAKALKKTGSGKKIVRKMMSKSEGEGTGDSGKPQPAEHTTLAGVVIKFDDTYALDETLLGGSYVFVAMATGTRCIPAASRCPKGSTVHDGHAEVLARRVFNRWLLEEIENCRNGERSLIFLKDGDRPPCLRDGVSFELLISALPCGDASIVEQQGRKRGRTGAKVVPRDGPARLPEAGDVESQDCSQARGVVRRKPGKGSPTSSVSCSDKILKWNLLGFQGCLMLPFIQEPLYFSKIIALTSDECGTPGNVDTAASRSMQRALWERACNLKECLEGSIFVRQTFPRFTAISVNAAVLEEHGLVASSTRKVSPGISAMWWAKASKDWKSKRLDYMSHIPKGDKNYCEVIVGKTGVKMGFQKSATDPPVCSKACSRISRASMRDLVQQMYDSRDERLNSGILSHDELKLSVCPEYMEVWNKLRQPGSSLSNWICKS